MRHLALVSALMLMLCCCSVSRGQTVESAAADDATAEKSSLLFDLQALEAKAAKLDKPLARALAKAEIADAAWAIDEDWAKRLLSEAYELIFPDEEERSKLRRQAVGSQPAMPNEMNRARWNVRSRIMIVAGRDKSFADQLIESGAKQLGPYEGHVAYAGLAYDAVLQGKKDDAAKYIMQAVEADPTQITAIFSIQRLAAQDRAAADKLIVQYIEKLRSTPFPMVLESIVRIYFSLYQLVFPTASPNILELQIQPPGPVVVRAYVSYMVEAFRQAEQQQPGILKSLRQLLVSVWLPLKQYAPELTPQFMELEQLSRTPGADASLPQKGSEPYKENYEKRVKEAMDSRTPDYMLTSSLITRGDFARARKMIELFPEGEQKTQLIEIANMREAIGLATNGDIEGAQRLAEKLNKATSILYAYPAIIEKCVARKDETCVVTLAYQAMKQLKRANTEAAFMPAGIPASVMPGKKEFDPVLLSFSKLAKAVAPLNETLALEILDETVAVANASEVETALGQTGFEIDVFRKLAAKNETRTRQAAENLKDPLRQIIALANVYQWKASELSKKKKAVR